MKADDPFDLERFMRAQEPILQDVMEELGAGRKQSHWMWFVFPQLRGLGYSPAAYKFGIASLSEAAAYLAHPVLGPRLIECTKLINRVEGRTPEVILGSIDALKFRSSMTLFAQVAGENSVFAEALRKYFGGEPDRLTLDRL